MPIFTYKGYDAGSGAAKKGKIEADSIRAARQKLRASEGVLVSELKEEVVVSGEKKNQSMFAGLTARVSLAELAVMTRQFATLQSAQVPLDECLKALTDQVENIMLRNTLSALKDLISEGKSLAEAMGRFPMVFDRLYVNMVKAGETSGNLGLVLERLADFQEYQVEVRGKVASAMAYPALMIGASLIIIAFLFISIVPKLQKVFDSMGVVLSWYTKALIQFSDFLLTKWFLLIAMVGLLYAAFKVFYKSKKGRSVVDRLILNVPIFGPVALRVNVSKFTKTLSTLLGSGVPIITALEITKNVIGNSILSGVLLDAKQSVQEGESLAAAIEKSHEFPSLVTHMIRTGEKTGELENMLRHVSNAYDAEAERKIDSLISLIEPLMIIFMGGIVAIVVVAMLLPMLSIMNQVKG